MMKIALPLVLLALTAASPAQEGSVPTQTLIHEDTKNPVPLTPANVTIQVNNHNTTLTSLDQVPPSGAQVALLLDDGLRTSFARNLSDMQRFVATLPAGTEIFIGYMQNGRVVPAQPFTTDHAAAAAHLRITEGFAGASSSPYFCLSDFVKHWPGPGESRSNPEQVAPITSSTGSSRQKARFVIMITNGVDPYNGSVSPLNQDSPYVQTAIRDAQRAGVPVYSIYFTDAGIRGGAASFSGQSYLSQLADATGGTSYYEGTFNPVSLTPFFNQFQKAIAETYVATFPAEGHDLVRLKVSTNLSKVKLRHSDEIRPGTELAN
jgi:hypothetical protein